MRQMSLNGAHIRCRPIFFDHALKLSHTMLAGLPQETSNAAESFCNDVETTQQAQHDGITSRYLYESSDRPFGPVPLAHRSIQIPACREERDLGCPHIGCQSLRSSYRALEPRSSGQQSTVCGLTSKVQYISSAVAGENLCRRLIVP